MDIFPVGRELSAGPRDFRSHRGPDAAAEPFYDIGGGVRGLRLAGLPAANSTASSGAGGDVAGDLGRWLDCGENFGFRWQRGQRTLKRERQHLVHIVHEVELHGVPDVVGQLGYVLLVGAGQDGFKEAGAQSGQQFLF
jgi:hypothetical protein